MWFFLSGAGDGAAHGGGGGDGMHMRHALHLHEAQWPRISHQSSHMVTFEPSFRCERPEWHGSPRCAQLNRGFCIWLQKEHVEHAQSAQWAVESAGSQIDEHVRSEVPSRLGLHSCIVVDGQSPCVACGDMLVPDGRYGDCSGRRSFVGSQPPNSGRPVSISHRWFTHPAGVVASAE